MKATGIVRRIDDLGRVVIPKEIRRTMRIREGDPLEIYTSKDGEVIFKKYSLMGGVDEFAAQLCDTLSKSTGTSVAVTDRDSVIAAAGSARRDLIGKRISPQLEQIMEDRGIYRAAPCRASAACSSPSRSTATARPSPRPSSPRATHSGSWSSSAPRASRPQARRSTSSRRPSQAFSASTWRAEKRGRL